MEIQELLDEHQVKYDSSGKNKNRPGWLNVCCPFCNRDPYLGINLAYGFSNCWNCGPHSLPEVLILLGVPKEKAKSLSFFREWEVKTKPRYKLELPKDLGPLNQMQKDYLRSRRLDPRKLVKLWGLKGIHGGPLAWRIWIPIYQQGELVTWNTRRITNKEPRYLAAKPEQSAVSIKECLYGIDYCRNTIIVVEGCFDVFSIGAGAAAIMGLSATPSQLQKISTFPNRFICFDTGDNEGKAKQRARELCHQLAIFPGTTTNITLDSGKDPGSASQKELQQLRRLLG